MKNYWPEILKNKWLIKALELKPPKAIQSKNYGFKWILMSFCFPFSPSKCNFLLSVETKCQSGSSNMMVALSTTLIAVIRGWCWTGIGTAIFEKDESEQSKKNAIDDADNPDSNWKEIHAWFWAIRDIFRTDNREMPCSDPKTALRAIVFRSTGTFEKAELIEIWKFLFFFSKITQHYSFLPYFVNENTVFPVGVLRQYAGRHKQI